MSNYSTQIKNAELDDTGLAINAGWIAVYHVNPVTREYQSASYEYLMAGVGLPADSYADEPELPAADQALRRRTDGKSWEHVPDYRGQTVYSTETRQAQMVAEIGNLPENITLLEPQTEFDQWKDGMWVTDSTAQQAATIKVIEQELASRKAAASLRINELTYAANLGIATDEETSALTEWQKYAVLLSRINVSAAKIEWPVSPQA